MRYEDVFPKKFRLAVSAVNTLLFVGLILAFFWLVEVDSATLREVGERMTGGMIAFYIGASAIYVWLFRNITSWPRGPFNAVSIPFLYGAVGLLSGFIILPIGELRNATGGVRDGLEVVGMSYILLSAPMLVMALIIALKALDYYRIHVTSSDSGSTRGQGSPQGSAPGILYCAVVFFLGGVTKRCPHAHLSSNDALSCARKIQQRYPKEVVSVACKPFDSGADVGSWLDL